MCTHTYIWCNHDVGATGLTKSMYLIAWSHNVGLDPIVAGEAIRAEICHHINVSGLTARAGARGVQRVTTCFRGSQARGTGRGRPNRQAIFGQGRRADCAYAITGRIVLQVAFVASGKQQQVIRVLMSTKQLPRKEQRTRRKRAGDWDQGVHPGSVCQRS